MMEWAVGDEDEWEDLLGTAHYVGIRFRDRGLSHPLGNDESVAGSGLWSGAHIVHGRV